MLIMHAIFFCGMKTVVAMVLDRQNVAKTYGF